MSRRRRVRERTARYGDRVSGPVYFDSSALLKLYLPEPGSDELDRAVEGRDDLLASDLTVTEIVSALARRVRDGALSSEQARVVHRSLVAGLDAGPYGHVDLDRGIHRDAERLLLDRRDVGLRATDALHLALAISARAGTIATFDRRLGAAARAVGLGTYPVSHPEEA